MTKLKNIAEEYLHSLPIEDKKARSSVKIAKLLKKGKLRKGYLGEVSEREAASLLFDKILPKSQQLQSALAREESPVLTEESWRDFNLLKGSMTTPEKSLLNDIKRTRTNAGDCVLATELVNPHTSLTAIRNKQATVATLLKNKETAQVVDKGMVRVQRREKVRLTHWSKTNELSHTLYRKALNGFYYGRIFPKRFNSSLIALQLRKWLGDFRLNWGLFYLLFLLLCYCCAYPFFIHGTLFRFILIQKSSSGIHPVSGAFRAEFPFMVLYSLICTPGAFSLISMAIPWVLCFYPFSRHWASLEEWQSWYPDLIILDGHRNGASYRLPPSLYEFFLSDSQWTGDTILLSTNWVIYSCLGMFMWYASYVNYKRKKSVLNLLADHLIAFQDLVLGARQVSKAVAQDVVLEKSLGQHLVATRQLLRTKRGRSLGRLIHNLERGNFRSRSFFFRNTGQLLQTYTLLKRHRDQLIPMIYEMGFVDGCALGIAKRVAESQAYDTKRQFTLGRFTQEAAPNALPMLSVKEMWHPGLNAKEAVPNDLAMNADGGTRLLVITGPNAGGKSTYVIGIGVNTILNQVIGYVAAAKFKQSFPFRRIISYINVTQNLAAGLSLGEAGMEVLRKHKEALEDNSEWGVLAILDEILNGTDPTKAEPLAKKILESRQEAYPRCLTLLTTHYMGLTKLADKDSSILNKKVVVKIPGSNGRKFDYTYKIEPGISGQNIVEDMLAEKGVL